MTRLQPAAARLLGLVLLFLLAAAGCGQEEPKEAQGTGQDESAAGGTIHFYNWNDYSGEGVLDRFTAETGIEVELREFEDEEAILAAIVSDPDGADLAVVSGSLIGEMIGAKLVRPLDFERIPNAKHIEERYRTAAYDPQGRYTVPYFWGTTGVVVNRAVVPETETSWRPLFDPAYADRIAMLNNPFEVLGAASLLLGFGVEPKSDTEFAAARSLLLEQRPLLSGYLESHEIVERMVSGELVAAQIYSGEGLTATDRNEDLEFYIPAEGAPIWVDLFVIPSQATNPEAAHALINFMQRPEIMGELASLYWYATPNTAALEHIDPEVLTSPAVFPPPEVLSRLKFFASGTKDELGETIRKTMRIWTELKTGE
jgi:spermidine/putrescine-binding protein